MNWVRCVGVAGAELDQACAALRAQAASMPGLTLRQRLLVTGALTWAAVIRGDRVAELAGHEDELRLSRELGHQDGRSALFGIRPAERGRHVARGAVAVLEHRLETPSAPATTRQPSRTRPREPAVPTLR